VPALVRTCVASALALIGIAIALAGVIAFHRARTTVNPLKPDATSALVTGGVYRFTRNPMYVGLLLVLAAWMIFLSSPWSVAGLPVFVFYLDRFQIAPEERVLAAKFGAAFADYRTRVRRWL
jgi:protein-S-isoprenylcysteine O-methyltransferase Ste14